MWQARWRALLVFELLLLLHLAAGATAGGASVGAKFRCVGNRTTVQTPVPYLGFVVRDSAVLDFEHKILMDWTPKAACSRSVAMFLDHLGYRSGKSYNVEKANSLPHDFREEYSKACGHSDGSFYTDPSWFRFKMVRNPFIRLVSSYYQVLRYSLLYFTKEQRDAMSFADFIGEFEKSKGVNAYHFAFGNHAGIQHQPFELTAYLDHLPAPYHRIIHVERGHEEITEMNAVLARRGNAGRPFNFTDVSFNDPRDVEEKVEVTEFIGRRPYAQIKDRHPHNYAVMYDADLRRRATRLLSWDLHLYNYSWPF